VSLVSLVSTSTRDEHQEIAFVARMSNSGRSEPARVGGWLLLLSRLLIVWHPLTLAIAAVRALDAIAVRGAPVVAVLVVRIIVTAVGVAAGIALSNRHAGAVTLAKIALISSGATDLFVYSTPYFPNNRIPGDTIYYVAASLAYHGGWLMYLFRSRRVRDTY
jgi:hypothetical protein